MKQIFLFCQNWTFVVKIYVHYVQKLCNSLTYKDHIDMQYSLILDI